MKLHFPWPEVAKILEEVRAATVVNPLYEQATGKGLWLVGDQGVYLMPNTKCEGKPNVVYAKECDPTKLEFDEWWGVKQASFGGDDGVEFIDIADIDALAAQVSAAGTVPSFLCIDLSPGTIKLTVKWKSAKKGRAA